MFKKLCLYLLGLGLFFSGAHAVENYTISGNVTFRYDGDIYICLYNFEKYKEFYKQGHELSKPECKYIRMNDDLKKAKQISFKFESIPKGAYVIVSYQDENGNGQVDFEGYHIKEYWGTYKENVSVTSPTWDMIKFDLEENKSGIRIQM